jgi:hypothetical protein
MNHNTRLASKAQSYAHATHKNDKAEFDARSIDCRHCTDGSQGRPRLIFLGLSMRCNKQLKIPVTLHSHAEYTFNEWLVVSAS